MVQSFNSDEIVTIENDSEYESQIEFSYTRHEGKVI